MPGAGTDQDGKFSISNATQAKVGLRWAARLPNTGCASHPTRNSQKGCRTSSLFLLGTSCFCRTPFPLVYVATENHIKTRCLIRTTARSSLAAGAFYRTSTLAESSGVWSWTQDRVLRSPYIRSAMMALGMCHCRH